MKTYTIEIHGIPHTVQLSDEDAKRYGDAAKPVKAAPKPADKARAASNKGS